MSSNILNKIGRHLLLDLINRENSTAFTFEDVVFGTPAVIPNPVGFRNTRVTVSAKSGGRYVGHRTVDYQRIDIAQLFKPQYRRMYATGVSNTATLIAQINVRFGLQIEPTDVVSEFIDTSVLPVTYTLKFRPESYAFIGQVELELVGQLPNLSDVITVNLLDGFHYPSEPIIANTAPQHITGSGDLLVASGIAGNKMFIGRNDEAEIFVGVHGRNLATQPQPTPVVDAYTVGLAPTQDWAISFGAALVETVRGNDLSMLYDVRMTITRESASQPFEKVELELKKDGAGKLVWGLSAGIQDIAEGTSYHLTQQRSLVQTSIPSTLIAAAFPNATKNAGGGLLGNYNIAISAMAKNAIYVNDVTFIIRAQIYPVQPAQA